MVVPEGSRPHDASLPSLRMTLFLSLWVPIPAPKCIHASWLVRPVKGKLLLSLVSSVSGTRWASRVVMHEKTEEGRKPGGGRPEVGSS